MTSVRKFSPFADVDDMPAMRHINDVVSRFFNEPGMRPWTPPVDILETENELLLKMDVPELSQKDVDIRLENDTLTIKGERKFEQAQGKGYHRIERSYGAFARSFPTPWIRRRSGLNSATACSP
jgi:HSP20 family protein